MNDLGATAGSGGKIAVVRRQRTPTCSQRAFTPPMGRDPRKPVHRDDCKPAMPGTGRPGDVIAANGPAAPSGPGGRPPRRRTTRTQRDSVHQAATAHRAQVKRYSGMCCFVTVLASLAAHNSPTSLLPAINHSLLTRKWLRRWGRARFSGAGLPSNLPRVKRGLLAFQPCRSPSSQIPLMLAWIITLRAFQ